MAAAKFAVGIAIGSLALISEALHSSVDVIATVITWLVVRMDVLRESGLLFPEAADAGPNDLLIAVRGQDVAGRRNRSASGGAIAHRTQVRTSGRGCAASGAAHHPRRAA